jgi:hypothetical protein
MGQSPLLDATVSRLSVEYEIDESNALQRHKCRNFRIIRLLLCSYTYKRRRSGKSKHQTAQTAHLDSTKRRGKMEAQ